jgi:uncharacterized protein YjiS (DUF1127 family)
MSQTFEIVRSSAGSRPSLLSAATGAVVRAGAWLARVVEAELDRRRTASLLGFADFELRDIGVSRADVYAALLAPAGEKPSEQLSRDRDERRRSEWAQAREARRDTQA